MEKTIIAKSGYKYIYSSNLNSIMLAPSVLEKQDIDKLNDETGNYYQKKKSFLREHGILERHDLPTMDIEYSPSYILSELANLNQLLIEVTDECNLTCKYCSYGELYGNYDIRKGTKQNFDNVKALIDYLCSLWGSYKNISFENIVNIGFFGGEPLMNFPIITRIIDYLETIKISGVTFVYNMTTNAVLLSKYKAYLVEKKIHLLISLDGDRENNVYRIAKNGKESFDVIDSNIRNLKKEYPEYFESNVNFNAVLHNRNSVVEIYEYIKNIFGKIPRISELNKNGVADERKDEFRKMFLDKEESLAHSLNCGSIDVEAMIDDSHVTQLNIFTMSYSGNVYKTLPDLFFTENKLRYYPTSTCSPFSRKIFLTVHGKILPCEKVGQKYPLGHIENGTICLDMEKIKKLYVDLYNPIVDKCRQCLLWKTCEICVFFLPRDTNNNVTCPYFVGEEETNNYFSAYISALESRPGLQNKIANEILI